MSNIREYIESTKDEINYCEACIYPDGSTFNCVPSHIYYILDNAISESRDVINKIMPISADVLSWLVDYSKCIAVYTDFCIAPIKMSNERRESLILLQRSGRIKNPYKIHIKNELELCKALCEEKSIEFIEVESSKRKIINLIDTEFCED